MKSLALASLLIAVAGLLCFGVLSLLHLPETIPIYLSSVIVGALPMVHQEIEKRRGASASALEGTPRTTPPPPVSSLQSSPSPAPDYFTTPPPIEGTGPPPSHDQRRFQADQPNPSPVYVRPDTIRSTIKTGEPVPVYIVHDRAPISASALSVQRSGTISWKFMLVYGVALVTALRQLSGALVVLFLPSSDVQEADFFVANLLILVFVDTVLIFFIGRWIGKRSDSYELQVTVGATALGLLAAYLLDFIFAFDFASSLGLGAYSFAFIFQSIILLPCAVAGWWLGHRARVVTPLDGRQG